MSSRSAKEILDKDASVKVFWADLADFDKRWFGHRYFGLKKFVLFWKNWFAKKKGYRISDENHFGQKFTFI